MGHNSLNPLETHISGDVGAAQHAGSIENIEALVFHRPHIEIINRHDIKNIQVVLAPEDFLVPTHGALQRIHGMTALAQVFFLHVDT